MSEQLTKDEQSVEDLLQKYGKWSLERMMRELESTAAERDQYKQIAELNAETIKGMQASVNLHAHRIEEIYGVKS